MTKKLDFDRAKETKITRAARAKAADPLAPDVELLSMLASTVVHIEEYLQPDAIDLDRMQVELALKRPKLKRWLKQMTKAGLAPLKRSDRGPLR